MNTTEMQKKIDNASLTANDIRENADTALLLLITNVKIPIEFHHEEDNVFKAVPDAKKDVPKEMIKDMFAKATSLSRMAEYIHLNANNPTFLLLNARMMQKQMEDFVESTMPKEILEMLDKLKDLVEQAKKGNDNE